MSYIGKYPKRSNPVDSGEETVMMSATDLASLYGGLLHHAGMPEKDAALVADTLVDADLRGVHSHGATWIPTYVKALRAGWINPHPNIRVVVDNGPIANIDGDNGMGQLASVKGMNVAIKKAKQSGIGLVGVRNSNHNGAIAYYTAMTAREDLIGFAAANAGATMGPWGGISPLLGSNPFSYSFPAGKEHPIVFDMACCKVAWSKFALFKARGERIPLGWALDKQGEPTDDPQEALDGLVLPVGEHKGYGLALMVDLMCGVLTGAAFDGDTVISWPKPNNLGHVFMAVDPSCFMPLAEFKSRVDEEIRRMHESARARGVDVILVPGERSHSTRSERLEIGIPMIRSVIEDLKELGREIGMTAG